MSIRDLKDNNYFSVKVTLNRCVFRKDLTFSRDDAFLISAGNLFHQLGDVTLNTQSPYAETQAPVIIADWMTQVSGITLMDTSSHRYPGAISLIDL